MKILLQALMTIRAALAPTLVLAGLLLLDGQLGPMTFQLRRATAAVFLAIVGIALVRSRRALDGPVLLAWATTAAVALAPNVLLATLGYALAVALLGCGRDDEPPRQVPGLAQACLTYVGLSNLPDLLPECRAFGNVVSTIARGYIRAATGRDIDLGPTALGTSAALAVMSFLFWRVRFAGAWIRPLAGVGLCAAAILMLPLTIGSVAAGPLGDSHRSTTSALACLAGAALIDSAIARRPIVAPAPATRTRRGIELATLMAALSIGIVLVGATWPWSPARRAILVHNRGGLDWERPVFGRFGLFSGGMFGLLPIYVRAEGYSFDVLDRDELRSEDLTETQTLVLINSPKEWSPEERRVVRDFVTAGGGLLVLGDHTDVFGLMRGFNSLLEDFGILFRFDSAYPARVGWRGCLATAPDAITSGWEAESPGMAIGASLELRGPARALLTGRYGHSDRGMRSNVVGSFLGNYAYEEGERLGDLPIIAASTLGRGRVVVLGDTTPFQGGLSYSFSRTVGPLFSLLSRPTNLLERRPAKIVAAVLLIATLSDLWLRRSGGRRTAVIASLLLVGASGAWVTSQIALQSPISSGPDCFLIDNSHLPAIGHYEARVNPAGPLETNLLRCGLRVAHLERWDRAKIAGSRGIAFVAPQRPFGGGEVRDLLRFEEEGGIVLVAAGRPDAAACGAILEAHDLALANRPLGSVPDNAGQGRQTPHFLDAWPIVDLSGGNLTEAPGTEVLYRSGGDVLALYRGRGRGGLILVADTRFFSSMNVEDQTDVWLGNLAFIHDLFIKYLRVDPGSVSPAFASPKKPE